MTHISGYGYDLSTITMFMSVIGHKLVFISLSLPVSHKLFDIV